MAIDDFLLKIEELILLYIADKVDILEFNIPLSDALKSMCRHYNVRYFSIDERTYRVISEQLCFSYLNECLCNNDRS